MTARQFNESTSFWPDGQERPAERLAEAARSLRGQ